jgi:hypothetical protein
MKKALALLFLTVALSIARGAGSLPEQLPAPAPVSVTVSTPVADLAAGYAAAIQQMSLKSLVIFLQGDGKDKVTAIRGIRSAKALNGVLLVTFSAGDMMAISAERIVMVTDGNRGP